MMTTMTTMIIIGTRSCSVTDDRRVMMIGGMTIIGRQPFRIGMTITDQPIQTGGDLKSALPSRS